MASQIASLTIVYLTVYSGADQRKHQCSASLAFVRGIHRWPVNSPYKWPVTQTMFSFYDVIMTFHEDDCLIHHFRAPISYTWREPIKGELWRKNPTPCLADHDESVVYACYKTTRPAAYIVSYIFNGKYALARGYASTFLQLTDSFLDLCTVGFEPMLICYGTNRRQLLRTIAPISIRMLHGQQFV